ncbi:hypothetical protein STRTUCAR8_00252 [Streptomyces turgidiscabies Car8]|uniref:Uncharacterized protein n=1 Tax=Streptomyces turgidiscabies (strain Car8) TaxID=698760 RepID=L7F1X5_STRT8|nr:hypothetical protein STRTUCAR8_00252 [Streptomyces turgidiscabies Car8]
MVAGPPAFWFPGPPGHSSWATALGLRAVSHGVSNARRAVGDAPHPAMRRRRRAGAQTRCLPPLSGCPCGRAGTGVAWAWRGGPPVWVRTARAATPRSGPTPVPGTASPGAAGKRRTPRQLLLRTALSVRVAHPARRKARTREGNVVVMRGERARWRTGPGHRRRPRAPCGAVRCGKAS